MAPAGDPAGGAVELAPWFGGLRDALSGSLTAIPPERRVEAARTLTAAGLGVHLDVIVEADGAVRGVGIDELRAVRTAVPDAVVDVHVIDLGGTGGGGASGLVVGRALAAVGGIGAIRITAAPRLLRRHARVIAALRGRGVAVWAELGTVEAIRPPDPVDGVLVMFIEPGTAGRADPTRVAVVTDLARSGPVGVDGGVDAELAHACVAAGAEVVVAGRALLSTRPSARPPGS